MKGRFIKKNIVKMSEQNVGDSFFSYSKNFSFRLSIISIWIANERPIGTTFFLYVDGATLALNVKYKKMCALVGWIIKWKCSNENVQTTTDIIQFEIFWVFNHAKDLNKFWVEFEEKFWNANHNCMYAYEKNFPRDMSIIIMN